LAVQSFILIKAATKLHCIALE